MNQPAQLDFPLYQSRALETSRELRALLELAGLLAGGPQPFILLTPEAIRLAGAGTTAYQAQQQHLSDPLKAFRLQAGQALLGYLCFRPSAPAGWSAETETRLQLLSDQLAVTISLLCAKEDQYPSTANADRKKAEKLKRAEKEIQKLSLMASETRTGIIITNRRVIPTWVNRAFEELLGYSRKELLGREVLELIMGPQSQGSHSLRVIKQRLKQKKTRAELMIYRKDGSPVWVSTFSAPLFDEHGMLESMVTMVVDITDEKKKADELRTLSLVASKTLTGAAVNDSDGNVFWVNRAFAELSGYTMEELRGKKIGDVLAGPETDMDALERARQQSRLKQPYEVELLNYKKDGTPFWVKVSGNPVMDPCGNVTHQVEIMNDITDRKIAELELIRTREEALQLSTAKEMFFSVMSHEIRTPLNSILGITQMLLDDSPRPDQTRMLNLLKFAGENLRTLINDILDLTKMETGNLTLETTPVDLEELSGQTIRSLRAKAEENNTTLMLQADSGRQVVLADPVRLYQILMNLVGNAIKFTKNGTVTVTIERLKETRTAVQVQFSVTDTGIGIPQDRLEAIFQPYTQASADTTRKYGGTGLGLAIVSNLLKIHGSEIRVTSEPGIGSTFSFAIHFRKARTPDRRPGRRPQFAELAAAFSMG